MTWSKRNGIFLIMMLSLLFCSGCGVPDKALVLTGDGTETGAEDGGAGVDRTHSGIVGGSDIGATSEPVNDEPMIMVYVCGAVQKPGVVELPKDSRAADALEAAGGLLETAQPDYVNLAAKLEDAQKLYFPTKEEALVLVREEFAEADGLVNINTAGIEQLCTLPGIGESRAKDIVAYREKNGNFQKKEDIMKVSGIKQSAYEKLQDYIITE